MGKESVIFETTDKRIVPEVMKMIEDSKVDGVNPVEIELFIRKNLQDPNTKLWVAFDGDEFTGFLLAYLVAPMIKPEVFIAWAYAHPKARRVGRQLNDAVEKWARSLKITKISAIVRKNVEAFQKKYGFKLEYYEVYKELKPEGGKDVGNVQVKKGNS